MVFNDRGGYSMVMQRQGGCFRCHGGNAAWFGKNAVGVAARHYDATGHHVWVDTIMTTQYGARDGGPDDLGLRQRPDAA